MNCINKTIRVMVYHFRQTASNPRIFVVLLMIALFVFENLRPVINFSSEVEIAITPYALPHLTNDFICQLVLMAGAVLLFCDAPFEKKSSMYMISRAGKISWAGGQILYIITLAFCYVAFITLVSILAMAGHLNFGTEWGKIWGTLAKTDAGAAFHVTLQVAEYIVMKYKPVEAMLISFLLEWACVVWLGLFIYCMNKLTKTPAGTMAGAFCILLDVCIANDWTKWANKFSPITLAQLKTFAGYNLQYHITLQYAVCFFCIGIMVLILVGILTDYKIKKRWR